MCYTLSIGNATYPKGGAMAPPRNGRIARPDGREDGGVPRGGPRRRGATLERAILHATWEELVAVGYANLTMERVAAHAGTSRAVLYRRWRSPPELVLAAIRQQAPFLSGPVPATGTLRGDVLALLRPVPAALAEG